MKAVRARGAIESARSRVRTRYTANPAAPRAKATAPALSIMAYRYVRPDTPKWPIAFSECETHSEGLANGPVWKYRGSWKITAFQSTHPAIPLRPREP